MLDVDRSITSTNWFIWLEMDEFIGSNFIQIEQSFIWTTSAVRCQYDRFLRCFKDLLQTGPKVIVARQRLYLKTKEDSSASSSPTLPHRRESTKLSRLAPWRQEWDLIDLVLLRSCFVGYW